MYACLLSHFSLVRLFATLWTVAHEAPLSLGFSRKEYWGRFPCPAPGDLPDSGIIPTSLMSPALAGGFFTTTTTWEAHTKCVGEIKLLNKLLQIMIATPSSSAFRRVESLSQNKDQHRLEDLAIPNHLAFTICSNNVPERSSMLEFALDGTKFRISFYFISNIMPESQRWSSVFYSGTKTLCAQKHQGHLGSQMMASTNSSLTNLGNHCSHGYNIFV